MKAHHSKHHGKRPGKTTHSYMLYVDETTLFQAMSLFGAIRALGSQGFRPGILDHVADLATIGERLVEDQIIEAGKE
jgi:hypothetical protein